MATQVIEAAWLDRRETITLTELCRVCALTTDELHELVAYGALAPVADARSEASFSAEWVMPLRAAGRLRRDLELDIFAVSILLGYLQRISALEGELRSMQALQASHAPWAFAP